MKKIIFMAMGILFSLSIQSQSNRYILDFTKHNQNSINVINKPYELNDIIMEVNSITGKNHQAFFDDYVIGTKTIPVEEYLAAMGLQLNGFLEEVYISPMDNLTTEQFQIKKGILGL